MLFIVACIQAGRHSQMETHHSKATHRRARTFMPAAVQDGKTRTGVKSVAHDSSRAMKIMVAACRLEQQPVSELPLQQPAHAVSKMQTAQC